MNGKIETIIAVAARNGVSLNKNFNTTFLSTHGFFEGPQAVAEQAILEMEKICFLGMNAGFDGQLKSALDKLSDVVTNLTAVKNGDVRELAKLELQKNRAIENIRETAYPVKTDARKALNEYIESSAEAIETIVSLKTEGEIFTTVDDRQIEYLEKSKEKLAALALILSGVMDVGSTAAGENAEKIAGLLKSWREDAARFMLTGKSLKYLDEAKTVAKDWGKIAVIPNKKDKLKQPPKYVRDEISIIADSRGGLETLGAFNARIQSQLGQVENMRQELNADKAKVAELKGKIADLEKRKRDIAIEFKNTGDTEKANRAIAEVRQEKDLIESEIKSLEGGGRLARKERDISNRREIALHIKHICDTLTDNKSDLVFLARVINHVDFNSLVGIMTGRMKDMEEARESILQIRVRVDELRKTYSQSADALGEEQEIMSEILEDEIFAEEEREVTANGLDSELGDLLKELEGQEEIAEKETEESEVTRVVHLEDDDL